MAKEFTIQQFMQLPENAAVMVPVLPDGRGGEPVYINAENIADEFVIACGEEDGAQTAYPYDLTTQEVAKNARIINIPKCPKCGRPMQAHLRMENGEPHAEYTCEIHGSAADPVLLSYNEEEKYWSFSSTTPT